MLRFEIGEQQPEADKFKNYDAVLLDIPFGKYLLSNPDVAIDQPSQKGGTCWYYSLSFLRPRYGKQFPENHPGRKIEKIFSQHRKRINGLEKIEGDYKVLIKSFGETTPITKNEAEQKLKQLLYSEKLSNKVTYENEIKLLNDFIKQDTFTSLQEYSKEVIDKKNIECCKETLVKLNIDPVEALENFKQASKKTTVKLHTAYHNIIRLQFYYHHQLKMSPWHPNDGIQSLIDALRKNGACAVGGNFGGTCYSEKPHELKDQFGKRPIYGWSKNSYREDPDDPSGHAIVVIGAQRVGKQGYVYYMDPNVPSLANGENAKVFKISYERFIQSIWNIYGSSNYINGTKTNVPGPFAMHANVEQLNYLTEFYRSYREFASTEELDFGSGNANDNTGFKQNK